MDTIKSPETHEKNAVIKGTLYLVGTPIGNLSDLSERAKKVLSEVDFIAAEDTRVSGAMLAKFGIKKPLCSYYEHNKKQKGEGIAERLAAGESCALVTDAGMDEAERRGISIDTAKLEALSGLPCAAVSALAVSGLFTGKFAFEGFLPTASGDRREAIDEIKTEKRTLIFYEAPHRLTKTLDELFSALGDRKIAVCRELTKINEEVIRTTLSGAVDYYKTVTPKGEFVLIIEGAPKEEENSLAKTLTIEEHVEHYISLGMSKSDAMKATARDRGVGKSEIYNKIMRKD